MTANRWWVRMAARWLARIDGVSGQLRLAMLGLTGVSTASLTLQSYGYGFLAPPLIAVTAVAGLAFAWYYTEGGVWNQMARDRQDLSNNFASPQARINTEMTARALVAGLDEAELSDGQRDAISNELDEAFEEHSDGIPLEEYGR
ncbi:MAG: hypothetical protein ACNS61_07510 [Candidatus Wenzhouxiangella sp. M2_3B_020]